jgi:hypothetical protein
MNFLYPIGLLALAGLIIPVLLHLWNVKQGKTLKIGSIAFLGEISTSSSKSFKITDWLLFLLRCLLVTLIALLLAEPYFKKTIIHNKNTGWILIDKNQFNPVYKSNQKTIDSLLNLGFELRDFNVGFKQFSLKDSLTKVENAKQVNYNSLINQLNKQMPAGYAAYVFANHQLQNFDGNLPKPNFKLVWKEVKQIDTIKTWSANFFGKSYEAKSSPSLTNYTTSQAQNLPTISVLIHHPAGADARYINAAITAISDFSKRKIEIKNWDKSASKADVGFWLSDEKISLSNLDQLKDSASLFTYQTGKILNVNTILNLNEPSSQTIELKQRIAFDELKGKTIWRDGFGVPVLLKTKEKELHHFNFYSRFNLKWTDLVWNEQFVKALLPIVLNENKTTDFGFEDSNNDQRVLAQQQVVATKINKTGITKSTINQHLAHIFWLLAFAILVIERILTFRKSSVNVKN